MTLSLALAASPVYAENLTVNFNPDPLFNVANFLPSDVSTGDVTVTNNTQTGQSVYAESINGFDPDGLGSQLYLKVFENANIIYQNEFNDFLSAGPVSLSSLGALANTTYTFQVSFINSNDNSYQGKSLGFDLCIGFSGGPLQCGTTVVSDPENPIPPPDGGGGGGGGGGQFLQLVIFNEFVSNIVAGDLNVVNGSATIEWDTNLFSTSQVIYGLSGVPYALNTSILPCLGYPQCSAENGTKVLHHSVNLFGLVGGQTYVYRVVSRASPPTVSVEHTFTMPTDTTGNPGIAQADSVSSLTDTVVSQVSQEPFLQGTSTLEEVATDNSNLLALALGGLEFPGLSCIFWAIIIFLALLGLIWLITKNSKAKSFTRDLVILIILSILVSLVLWFIHYTCPIIPLWVITIIYIVWRFLTRDRKV